MIPDFIKRLFKGRAKTPAPPVSGKPHPDSDMPSGDDYTNEICRWIFRDGGCRMMMGTIDNEGNLHITSNGGEKVAVIPPQDIPRNDSRIY